MPEAAPRELAPDEVQVWWAALEEPSPTLEELAATLSEDERARAGRFLFDRDRRRFVACRGILRALLAPHAGVNASAVRFRYNVRGKPALDGPDGDRGIRFNVSHSHTVALFALTRGREVGVDVEKVRPLDAECIAERFFSKPEREALREVPSPAKLDAFFTCWTRKEAYVKALGQGLGYPLDGFAVTVTPGAPARLWSTGGDEQETARWSLAALAPAPGYVAALVVEGQGWRLASAAWPPR